MAKAIDEQENKFDDFIQNILKSSAAGESAEGGASSLDGGRAQTGPATLSLAEKLSALSTVRFHIAARLLVSGLTETGAVLRALWVTGEQRGRNAYPADARRDVHEAH